MINCIEDYDISYNLFLAEQEMFTNLAKIEYDICNESATLVSLQEGIKDTIMLYLQKIMTQIQKIWSKFQANFSSKIATFLEEKVEPLFDKADQAEFLINNFRVYDLNKLSNYKVENFEYTENTKEDYKSVSTYINKQYPGLLKDDSTDIKTALLEKISTVEKEYKVTKDILIREVYDYCKKGYKANVASIANDIKSLNNSSKSITSMVSDVSELSEALNLWNDMSLHLITEDKTEKDNKMTFTDPGEPKKDENGKPEGSNIKITSSVNVYMTANTKLLSAKMSMVNGKFSSCVKILKHFVSFYNKNKSPELKPGEKVPTTAPVVDTNKKIEEK